MRLTEQRYCSSGFISVFLGRRVATATYRHSNMLYFYTIIIQSQPNVCFPRPVPSSFHRKKVDELLSASARPRRIGYHLLLAPLVDLQCFLRPLK